ncbi:MAG TPA: Na+/H+ antiporter subunit E [Steroidobacteraceae bacterium]|nr:Na+/H+ antiporter subunit E [Steroidobacteraceae bacterium]
MNRPAWLLGLGLVLGWMVLNDGYTPGHLLFAVLLATLLMRGVHRLRPTQPRVRRLGIFLPLIAHVLVDIVRSNVAVARFAFRPGLPRRSGFVEVPIELRDPHGLSVLAAIVTATPGTAWAGVSDDGRVLRLHVLDVAEGDELVRHVQERYERPLRRIFE